MSHFRSYKNHAALLQNKPDSVSGEISDESLAAAKAAVDLIISSGVVSRRSNCDHFIAISGHENPGHEPTKGYANDSLQITVTQKDVDVPVEAAPGEDNG